ncbi:MAG: hypothetical protein ACLQOO_15425 [Terriglobia bacterium]
MGSAEDDISILMTYVAIDHYLTPGKSLGFVITQTVFHSKGGGQGFRGFSLGETPIKVERVSDFSSFQPFEGATNKTAVIVLSKGNTTTYPVPYTIWHKIDRGPIDTSLDWSLAEKLLQPVRTFAKPIGDATSPWLVSSGTISRVLEKVTGRSTYRARLGIYSSPTSVFWVRLIGSHSGGTVLVENEAESGKKRGTHQFRGPVEVSGVWPLARGRDLDRWCCRPSKNVIMAYNAEDGKPMEAAAIKRCAPKLYGYLHQFENALKARKNFQKYFDIDNSPFWAMFNVGPYTFAPYRVAWRYVDSGFRCAVISQTQDPHLGERTVIADGKLVIVPFQEEDAAHFVCALLNSSMVQLAVKNYAVSTQISTHIMDYIAIPPWNGATSQRALAKLSIRCHAAARKDDAGGVAALETEIDKASAEMWGVGFDELKAVQEALMGTPESKQSPEEDEE